MGGGYVSNSGRQTPSYSFAHLVPVRHWVRDPALRSWPVLLLVGLVCVPPIALVMLNDPTPGKIRDIAWIFAAYFAVAWLLLLGVIVRPQHVSRAMLAAVAVVGIATQAPTAIFLETKLHAGTSSLLDIFTIGLPEELAKAIPIVVVAWIWRRYWHTQTPRDYLFLGAVSGLVFGAAEVVHYFTDVLGSLSGNVNGLVLQDLTIQYIWRFLTDPIDHACWAGITGYFIGLAIVSQDRKYWLGLVGIGIAAVLHGLNDWNPINSHPAWVLVTLISVLLFLGYARAGAWLPEQAMAAPDGLAHAPAHQQAHAQAQPAPWAAAPPAPRPGSPAPPRPADGRAPRAPAMGDEWWQHVPAASTPPAPPAPATAPHAAVPSNRAAPHAAVPSNRAAPHAATPYNPATAPTVVQRKPPVRPWWEQER
jgi:RsiW-degrading membrane proteinase PrsW (M82 family)